MVSINLLRGQRYDERLAHKRAKLELFAGVCVIASRLCVLGMDRHRCHSGNATA